MQTISERIEQQPFNRFHLQLLILGGLGLSFDALEGGIISFILPILRTEWGLTSVQAGWIGSSTYIGFLPGSFIAGILADRFGRKPIMMGALLLFAAATFIAAFANNFYQFVLLRFIAGMGMGAELAVVFPYLSEFVGSRYRAKFNGALAGFISVGFVLSAIMSYYIVPMSEEGWRWLMMIASMPVLLLLWFRRALHESPMWLETVGRHQEAAAICDRMGAMATHSFEPVISTPATPTKLAVLFSSEHLKTTIAIWMLWISVLFCYYAFLIWIPGLLIERGFTITQSFSFTIFIYLAQIPGFYSASYFCDKVGRRWAILIYIVISCFAASGLALANDESGILLFSMLLSFGMNGIVAAQYLYTAEIYPTHIRVTGSGAASSFGRIGSISSPVIVGATYPLLGFNGVFLMMTLILLTGGIGIWLLGKETRFSVETT